MDVSVSEYSRNLIVYFSQHYSCRFYSLHSVVGGYADIAVAVFIRRCYCNHCNVYM